MNSKVSFRVLCVLALVAILAVACGGKPNLKEQIIGKWQGDFEGTAATIEFTADGKMILSATISDQTISIEGVYSFVDDDTIEISIPDMGNEKNQGDIKIDGDTLTLTDPNGGDSSTLTRAK